jgi:hypothetical protein
MISAREALDALRDLQEEAATSGRDFGRGFAHAVALLDGIVTAPAALQLQPDVYVSENRRVMVMVLDSGVATVASRAMESDRWSPPGNPLYLER